MADGVVDTAKAAKRRRLEDGERIHEHPDPTSSSSQVMSPTADTAPPERSITVQYTKTVVLTPATIAKLPLFTASTAGIWQEASDALVRVDLNQAGCDADGLEGVLAFAQGEHLRITPTNVLSVLKAADYVGSQEIIDYVGASFPRILRTMGIDLPPLLAWLLAHPRLHEHSVVLMSMEYISKNITQLDPALWATLPQGFVAWVLKHSHLPMNEYRTFYILKSILNARRAANMETGFISDSIAMMEVSKLAKLELETMCSDLLRTHSPQYNGKVQKLELRPADAYLSILKEFEIEVPMPMRATPRNQPRFGA